MHMLSKLYLGGIKSVNISFAVKMFVKIYKPVLYIYFYSLQIVPNKTKAHMQRLELAYTFAIFFFLNNITFNKASLAVLFKAQNVKHDKFMSCVI